MRHQDKDIGVRSLPGSGFQEAEGEREEGRQEGSCSVTIWGSERWWQTHPRIIALSSDEAAVLTHLLPVLLG